MPPFSKCPWFADPDLEFHDRRGLIFKVPSSGKYPAPQSELTLQRPVARFLARFGKVALGGIYAGFAAALLLCLVGILMGDASDGLLKVDAAHPAFGGGGRRGEGGSF